MIREAVPAVESGGLWCYIAEAEVRIVGAIVFIPVDRNQAGVVKSMGVVKEWRRQGIGYELKQRAMAQMAKHNARAVWSEVHRGNFAMTGLNAKLGIAFTPSTSDGEYLNYGSDLNVEIPGKQSAGGSLRREHRRATESEAARPNDDLDFGHGPPGGITF